jgi:hypothetical protein
MWALLSVLSRQFDKQKEKAIGVFLNGLYFYAGDDRSLP